jgi:hypothetical protein
MKKINPHILEPNPFGLLELRLYRKEIILIAPQLCGDGTESAEVVPRYL